MEVICKLMKRFGLILLLMATLALSCTRDPLPGHDSSEIGFKTIHYKVLVSSFDDTKATTADNNTKYVFQATDSLYVSSTDPDTGDVQLFGVLKLISGSGETTAYFEGDLVGVNEFEPASGTPVDVTLVSSNDRIHTTGGGKLTGTAYPSNEYATSLADAVQKFSHFTCSTTFGATRFTLTQQSAFLVFTVSFKRTEVAVTAPVTAKVFNNSEVTPVWQAEEIRAAALGSGRSRVDFVVAFPGGSTSLTDAELSVIWGNGENDHKEFAIGDKDLAVNHYYKVSRTTIDLGNPFHIRAKEDGTNVTFKYTKATGGIQYICYDLGVDDWTDYDGSTLALSKDYVVYFKGTREDCDCIGATQLFITANHQVCYIGGNITSLLDDPTQFAANAFRSAFSNGTCVDAITTPAEVNWVDIDPNDPLLLPNFTSTECYREMFRNCTSLTSAPDLPAETAADGCYWNMFRLCTGLKTADINLAATTLGADSCRELFRQCTELTSVPIFRASALAVRSYKQMLAGCKKLGVVTCLATNITASGCLENWMQDIKSKGTFYKSSAMNSFAAGSNGIPSGWTVTDYVAP